jgi:hypothetical protein
VSRRVPRQQESRPVSASGGAAKATEAKPKFEPAFEGQRPPFEPGNDLAVTHGAYSRLRISEGSGPIAETLREQVEAGIEGDEAAIEIAAYTIRQLQLSAAELERVARGESQKTSRVELLRLSEDSRGWTRTALEALDRLGLTPAGRVRLDLAVARTRAADRSRIELGNLAESEITELRRLLLKASGEPLALMEAADA